MKAKSDRFVSASKRQAQYTCNIMEFSITSLTQSYMSKGYALKSISYPFFHAANTVLSCARMIQGTFALAHAYCFVNDKRTTQNYVDSLNFEFRNMLMNLCNVFLSVAAWISRSIITLVELCMYGTSSKTSSAARGFSVTSPVESIGNVCSGIAEDVGNKIDDARLAAGAMQLRF